MIVVIFAGGSGTRLWPLSTNNNPKQLLELYGDKSPVQTTYERAKSLSDDIYFVPETRLTKSIQAQLPGLPKDHFVVEPGLKGTVNCVLAALAHVTPNHDHDEPIAFIHADHFIRDRKGFVKSFKTAEKVTNATKEIVLVGIEPTYPATGFEYIQKNGDTDAEGLAYNVLTFKTRPPYEIAQEYLKSGDYLWNAGYFIASLNTFLQQMSDYTPNLKKAYDRLLAAKSRKEFEEIYLGLESDTIDFGLIQKVKHLMVVPASFDWVDVGSFKDLYSVSEHDKKGNHTKGPNIELDNVENSYIRNEEDKPIAVIGLDNIVVVNSPNGVLVARKDLSQNVGKIAKKVQALD
ncbi:MAG TPA: sugar phosphate nucleotidyltransferase [Candidatus Saccharimonadales bacterium]|nr:sugar phosphate nucleotidyltransferase [Candidatus Saccharimonadales bacterium]